MASIYSMVKKVECRIRSEIAKSKGFVIFDRWSVNRTYYIGMIVSYLKQQCVCENSILVYRDKVEHTLIALLPIAKSDSIDSGSDEATDFNPDNHLQFIRCIFQLP